MTTTQSPDGGTMLRVNGFETNYHDQGNGEAVVFLHGSGPGVSAWSNWSRVIPELAQNFRAIALDLVGFGATERPEDIIYGTDAWMRQTLGLLDALGIERFSLVGNSMGGRISQVITARHPERVQKLVLMGSPGPFMKPTASLGALRAYTPSEANMRSLMVDQFLYDPALVTDDLVKNRYQSSIRPGAHEAYVDMFHNPKHRGGQMPLSATDVEAFPVPALLLHGREDRVIPMQNSLDLFGLIPNAQLHIFGRCGHWVQFEHTAEFITQVRNFLER
jgi:pimeloyl-ACP methyl ester carboxylesterase